MSLKGKKATLEPSLKDLEQEIGNDTSIHTVYLWQSFNLMRDDIAHA